MVDRKPRTWAITYCPPEDIRRNLELEMEPGLDSRLSYTHVSILSRILTTVPNTCPRFQNL